MSWSLVVLPLHAVARDRVSPSAYASALAYAPALAHPPASAHALAYPDALAPVRALPRVDDVVGVCAAARVHGTARFTVTGRGAPLPPCPDPAGCAYAGGNDDLGELSVHVAGAAGLATSVGPDTVVDAVGLAAPSGRAALRVVCGLTAVTGALFVCDDVGGPVAVVWPHERYDDRIADWPW